MNNMQDNHKFDKLIWIELIGFDNRKPDFGVSALLSKMKVRPSKIALLLCDTELIHAHENLDSDFRIGAQHCSYVARPYNSERKRQDDWTAFQLRGLNRVLKQHGIESYAAFFDYVMFEERAKRLGIPDYDAWNSQHKELLFTLANGATSGSVCHFKHLSDGRLYEDFFSEQLKSFLTDYEFDGWLACDGFAHPRLPIYNGDFSDDVTGQFEQYLGRAIPNDSVAARSAHILANLRLEWMRFCVKRQGDFIRKTVAEAKSVGKKVIAFNAWTRDPFEAIWRYGTDYRDIRDAGVEGMVLECCAGVLTIENWNRREDTEMLDRTRSMILRISGYLRDLPLYQLYAVKDDCEEYCVLRHAPSMAATEVQANASMSSAITGRQSLSGALVCLGDAIEKHEWAFLDGCLKSIFDIDLGSPLSPMLLWSDSAMWSELENYASRQICNSFRLCAELIANGTPISLVGDCKAALDAPERPVLVVHPTFHSQDELDNIVKRCKTVFFIGLLDTSSFGLRLFVNGICKKEFIVPLNEKPATEEPALFWCSQPEMLPARSFWKRAAALIANASSLFSRGKSYDAPIYIFDSPALRLIPFDNGLLFAVNTSKDYMPAEVISRRSVKSAESLTFYPAMPVTIVKRNRGSLLKFKIPPLGTAILRLKYQ